MGEVIGIVGGVASGKSRVSSILAQRGLTVLDADAEARQAVREPAILEALVERFGQAILAGDGSLDRAALADRAFRDPRSTADLNGIVHPRVRERLLEQLRAAGDAPVVLDVPLLLESPLAALVSTWIFVEASESLREARARSRNWDPGERARRESRQADLSAKRSRAEHVLENNGTIEDLERSVDALLERIGVTPPSI